MFNEEMTEFVRISQAVGNRIDLVQGGGGNTSAKLDDEKMAIKASGFRISQITSDSGYVVVNYKNIGDFYRGIDLSEDPNPEAESTKITNDNILDFGIGKESDSAKKLRPSVEVGFHSLLKKYVVHTHTVYTNILGCSVKGFDAVDKIFKQDSFGYIWVPYINPGFSLTVKIRDLIHDYMDNMGNFPKALFMENHGLVVTSDNSQECLDLNDYIDNKIIDYLKLDIKFPDIELEKINDGEFRSKTRYMADFMKNNRITPKFLNEISLYPDQLVYLNANIQTDARAGKLIINNDTRQIVYKCSFSEAMAMEETLAGYLFVINEIRKRHLSIKTIGDEGIKFIQNWESEAYRRSLMKSQDEKE